MREFICVELIQQPDYPLADDQPLVSGGLIDSAGLAYLGVFVESTFDVYVLDADLTPESLDTLDQIVARILDV